jgi:hypothetical protein
MRGEGLTVDITVNVNADDRANTHTIREKDRREFDEMSSGTY